MVYKICIPFHICQVFNGIQNLYTFPYVLECQNHCHLQIATRSVSESTFEGYSDRKLSARTPNHITLWLMFSEYSNKNWPSLVYQNRT